MKLIKKEALDTLKKMYFLYKVEQGRRAIKKGDFYTEADVKKRLSVFAHR